MNEKYRKLPAVGKLLQHPSVKALGSRYPQGRISATAAKLIDDMRANIGELPDEALAESAVIHKLQILLERQYQPNLRRVINATGVILHTNLGRALLSEQSVSALHQVAEGYNNIELNLDTGKRGSRYSHVEQLLCELTGAEAALVVNNNAAAVLLVLREMAQGGEVIVSRGELVEIGGSFRVSEVMQESQAILVEVGTTNKTHAYDYERHITERTKLLLKVHTSNYRIIGFTESVSSEQLVQIAGSRDIPVYEDLGSGMLFDLKQRNIGDEPTVQEVVSSGVDIVSFSGDKLLGGPQAGIIVGKKQYIDRIKRNPLNRALRIDKFTVAALEATLLHYLQEDYERIPVLEMIMKTEVQLLEKANKLAEGIRQLAVADQCVQLEVQKSFSQIGGGALPQEQLPTYVVSAMFSGCHAARVVQLLRETEYPVIPRIVQERIQFDVRTIAEEEIALVVSSIEQILYKYSSRH